MSKNSLATALAILLTFTIVALSAFFIVPQKAQAAGGIGDIVYDPTNWVENAISAVQETITAIATPVSAAANVAMQVNAYVLQPLAFVLSGKLMKMLTAGVIAFVIGKANGTGVPQFVADVMASMQTVSDSAALAYLKQINNTNSPFASSITSALNRDYLTKTSLAGFWAANMCNLRASSPNVPAYLSGNWSQGGISAWFALTTQVQNNPYTLYGNTQSKLASVIGSGVGGVTGARSAQLSWGNGFMSWCGASDTATQPAGNNPDEAGSSPSVKGVVCTGTDKYDSDTGTCVPTALGVNPGDPCTNKDGTPGTVQTPGSTIKATLDKVLGGQQDQIVRMGNVGGQITSILNDIGTIMNTVNFASQLLGGSDSNSGLLNAGNSSSSGTSRLSQFADTSNYFGVTNAQVYKDAATLPSSGSSLMSQVAQYQAAWSTIGAAASTASTSVASLITTCQKASLAGAGSPFALAASAQVVAAQDALRTEITPVFAQASTATTIANAATAMVQRVQNELNSGSETKSGTYATDLQTLQTMSPTPRDVALAQQNAQAFGVAVATPAGSLTVASTSSSIVDQMNLISSNAQALKATVCTESSMTP